MLNGNASQAFYWLDKLTKGDFTKFPTLVNQILNDEQKASEQVNKSLSNLYAITAKFNTCAYPTIARLIISSSAIFQIPITREIEETNSNATPPTVNIASH